MAEQAPGAALVGQRVRFSSNGHRPVDNFRIVKLVQISAICAGFQTFTGKKCVAKTGHQMAAPEAKKEAVLSDDLFSQCHGLPESRAPKG